MKIRGIIEAVSRTTTKTGKAKYGLKFTIDGMDLWVNGWGEPKFQKGDDVEAEIESTEKDGKVYRDIRSIQKAGAPPKQTSLPEEPQDFPPDKPAEKTIYTKTREKEIVRLACLKPAAAIAASIPGVSIEAKIEEAKRITLIFEKFAREA